MKIDFGKLTIEEVSKLLLWLLESDNISEQVSKIKIIDMDEEEACRIYTQLRFEGVPDEIIPEMEWK